MIKQIIFTLLCYRLISYNLANKLDTGEWFNFRDDEDE